MNITIDENKLKRKEPISAASIKLWEHKTINIHRGVIQLMITGRLDIQEIINEVRRMVHKEYDLSFIRGFGFGIIIDSNNCDNIDSFDSSVDSYDNKNASCQWIIIINHQNKTAIGKHTWIHGYLRPVYDSIISQIESNGYKCSISDIDMPYYFKMISKMHSYLSISGILRKIF